MKYTFTKLDVCLPDYFQGHSGVVLAVPVQKSTTKQELTELIQDEYNSCDYEKLPDLTNEVLAEMCNDFILIDEPFAAVLEEDENYEETVYLYFTVEENE